MTFIDIHCHLDQLKNIDKEIKESIEKGVKIILVNGINLKNNKEILELAKTHKEISPCLGIYPQEAELASSKEIKETIGLIKSNNIAAIGEIGLDLKWSETLDKQIPVFKKLVNLGIELNIPLIIHSRKAELECIEILENLKAKKVIMHCFTGKKSLIKKIIDNSWFLTVSTNVVYSEQTQNLVKVTPLTQMFCETDSPYMHPFREKINSPKNILEAYKKIAEIKGISLKEVEEQIEENYKKLFD